MRVPRITLPWVTVADEPRYQGFPEPGRGECADAAGRVDLRGHAWVKEQLLLIVRHRFGIDDPHSPVAGEQVTQREAQLREVQVIEAGVGELVEEDRQAEAVDRLGSAMIGLTVGAHRAQELRASGEVVERKAAVSAQEVMKRDGDVQPVRASHARDGRLVEIAHSGPGPRTVIGQPSLPRTKLGLGSESRSTRLGRQSF